MDPVDTIQTPSGSCGVLSADVCMLTPQSPSHMTGLHLSLMTNQWQLSLFPPHHLKPSIKHHAGFAGPWRAQEPPRGRYRERRCQWVKLAFGSRPPSLTFVWSCTHLAHFIWMTFPSQKGHSCLTFASCVKNTPWALCGPNPTIPYHTTPSFSFSSASSCRNSHNYSFFHCDNNLQHCSIPPLLSLCAVNIQYRSYIISSNCLGNYSTVCHQTLLSSK